MPLQGKIKKFGAINQIPLSKIAFHLPSEVYGVVLLKIWGADETALFLILLGIIFLLLIYMFCQNNTKDSFFWGGGGCVFSHIYFGHIWVRLNGHCKFCASVCEAP